MYATIRNIWVKGLSQRQAAMDNNISRDSLRQWEKYFVQNGAIGLLTSIASVDVDPKLVQRHTYFGLDL